MLPCRPCRPDHQIVGINRQQRTKPAIHPRHQQNPRLGKAVVEQVGFHLAGDFRNRRADQRGNGIAQIGARVALEQPPLAGQDRVDRDRRKEHGEIRD